MASNYNMTIETATEEFDSLGNVSGCTKNPGHEHFYSVADLNYDILPVGLRNEQCLTYIRNWSKRVVKLTVTKANGTKLYGTGYLMQLEEGTGYVMKDHDYGIFVIVTNEHVLSTQEDVESCKIEFFFDTEDRLGIETCYGVQLIATWKKQDLCMFTLNPVPQVIKQLVSDRSTDLPAVDKNLDVIVISHPHGCRKTITIGKLLGGERGGGGDDWCHMAHSARTCKGSSGGLTLTLMLNKTMPNGRPLGIMTHFKGMTGDVYHGKLEVRAYTIDSETGNINYCTVNYNLV